MKPQQLWFLLLLALLIGLTGGGALAQTPADTDGDGLPDPFDACPTEAGLYENYGCPAGVVPQDSDGDSLPDVNDACPQGAGDPMFNGCPDTDGDQVGDNFDACPAQVGFLQNSGCPLGVTPDLDGDGIPDPDDACGSEAGEPAFAGCPAGVIGDFDGDGVLDALDACFGDAGSPANGGCPQGVVADFDLDGVPDAQDACPRRSANRVGMDGCPLDADKDLLDDSNDACPNEVGNALNNGCPDGVAAPDSDGDGNIDLYDRCLTEAGDNGGDCPDADKDFVADIDDQCPAEAGLPELTGCPAQLTLNLLPRAPLNPANLTRLGGLLVGHSAFQTSLNGRLFVQGYQNILIYDLAAQGTPVQLLESLGGYLAVADDGVTLVATGYDGNVQQPSLTVWDASTATSRHYLTLANEFNINQIAISPDGTRFATAHGLSEGNFIGQETPQPSVVRLWDMLAGTQSAELPHPTGINQLAFSPDGTRLVTGSGRTATVWDLNTNTPVTSFPINAVLYNRLLAFSPDGTRLAVGQSDGTLNVYETGGYSLLYSVPLVVDNSVTFAIYSLAFSPDGTRLTVTLGPFFDGPMGELDFSNPELAGRAVIVKAADGTLEGSVNFGSSVPIMSGFSPDGSYLIVSVNNALEFYGTAP